MLFSLVVLCFFQVPERTHQPVLVDPGLHGGRIFDQTGFPSIFDTTSDVTPDGRVRIGFRQQLYKDNPDPEPDKYLWALIAGAVDTDRIQSDEHGDLSAFYDPTDVTPDDEEVGENFAFSSVSESNVIYWSPPFVGSDTEPLTDDEAYIMGTNPPVLGRCTVDGGLPLPIGGASNVTVAMQPLNPNDPERGENPYPSDASGVFDINGTYRTYRLWAVLDHYGEPTEWECDGTGYLAYLHPLPFKPRLVALKLKVVVDVSAGPPTIYSAAVEQKPFQLLTFVSPLTLDPTEVFGIEPSINADGTLIVYHGDGVNGTLQSGGNRLMYVWNPNGCSPTGWSEPRSVTDVPPPEFPGAEDEFKRLYGFASFPIREPDNAEYAKGDLLYGAYPWVSKDGSFLVAMHINMSGGRRAGMFVVGDITGGYIKHIDDTALNPTRLGGRMDWPQTEEGSNFTLVDTGRTTLFSTGLKPGLWEPFLGAGIPVPTQRASERIPVLPIFVHRTRQYGEVRFEEADGNYLLYLACNESFKNDSIEVDGGDPFMNPRQTPDTSGRLLPDGTPARRAICSLNDGAAFPQEFMVESLPGHPDPVDQLRQWIGATIGENGQRLHENVGYKGQAIIMSPDGRVDVDEDEWPDYGSKLTVQAFVKSIAAADLPLVEDPGRFLLKLNADGSVTAQVTLQGPSGTKVVASSTGAVPPAQNILRPGEGWRHLALVFDGSVTTVVGGFMQFDSRLDLYVDGVVVDTREWDGPSQIGNPSATIYVGPGRSLTPAKVSLSNFALVLDEVAISRVARTRDEILRDGYLTLDEADVFEPLPTAVELPDGFDRSKTSWPTELTYDAAKVALGDALFESPLLSKNSNRSCATCHVPGAAANEPNADYFADAQPFATSEVGGNALKFNVPTALNMAFGTHKQFDGSAASVVKQLARPILGAEMGPQTMNAVLNRIKNDNTGAPPLWQLFDNTYLPPTGTKEDVTRAHLEECLAMYVLTLVSGESAYDNDLAARAGSGGPPFSDPAVQRGRALFFGKARCFGCHRGINFSDDDFHNIGTVQASEGITVRGGFTGRSTENGQVKTPTLRNVAETGPWFHDGSKTTLTAVIEHYNAGFAEPDPDRIGELDRQLRPLGLDLEPGSTEIADLVAFLGSLTGTVPD